MEASNKEETTKETKKQRRKEKKKVKVNKTDDKTDDKMLKTPKSDDKTKSDTQNGQIQYQNLENQNMHNMQNMQNMNPNMCQNMQSMNTYQGYAFNQGQSPTLPMGQYMNGMPNTPVNNINPVQFNTPYPGPSSNSENPFNQMVLSKLALIESSLSKLLKLDSIEEQVGKLSNKITSLDMRVKSLESSQGETVRKLNDIEASRNFDTQVLEEIKTNQLKYEKQLSDSQKSISCDVKSLQQQNQKLNEDLLDLQSRSMRDNLIFFNIEENNSHEERRAENCTEKIMKFCREKLNIADAETRFKLDRAHRMGGFATGKIRPIVVKFNFFRDKQEVKEKARALLKDTGYRVSDQYPQAIRERRKKLMPMFQDALRNNQRAYLSYDKLYINGRVYTADNVPTLPGAAMAASGTNSA